MKRNSVWFCVCVCGVRASFNSSETNKRTSMKLYFWLVLCPCATALGQGLKCRCDDFFLKGMFKCKVFDAQVAEIVFNKLAKRRWCLQQEIVIYYLFRDRLVITDSRNVK